jgi:arginine decarboxylase
MAAVKSQLKSTWWFDVWQPDEIADGRADSNSEWVLKPGDRWHGFEGLAENHVLVDPIKVTILTPGLAANGAMQKTGIPAAVVVKFLSSRRIEIEKTGLYSFLVLFSMGITKGKWSTLVTELPTPKDLYDANAPLKGVLRGLVEVHPDAYATWVSRIFVAGKTYREDNLPKAQKDMYTTLPYGDAFGRCTIARARKGGSVEIDALMDARSRDVVLYPPGIP